MCVLQSLLLLQYLVRNGSERVVTSAREHVYDLKPLENFQFIDETGKDQGLNGVLDLDQLWTPTNCDESMCICVCACMRACVRATSTPFAPLNPPCLSPLLLFSPLPSTHLCTLLPLLPSSHPPLLPKLSPSCLAYPLTISSSLPPFPSPSLHPSFSSSESEGSAGLCPRRCAGARGEEEGQGYQGQVRWLVLRRGCQQIQ